jgi:hypothetical protein
LNPTSTTCMISPTTKNLASITLEPVWVVYWPLERNVFLLEEENLLHDIELEIGSLDSRHEENAWTQQREHIDYNDDLEEVQWDDVVIHEGDMTQEFQQPQKFIPNTMPPPTQHEMA